MPSEKLRAAARALLAYASEEVGLRDFDRALVVLRSVRTLLDMAPGNHDLEALYCDAMATAVNGGHSGNHDRLGDVVDLAGRAVEEASRAGMGAAGLGGLIIRLGSRLEQRGALEEAVNEYLRAYHLLVQGGERGRAMWASRNVRDVLVALGRLPDALPFSERIVENAAGGASVAYATDLALLGRCLAASGRKEEARNTLERAIATLREAKGASSEELEAWLRELE